MARVSLRKSNFLTRQQLLCLSPCKMVTTNTINGDYKLTANKVAKHLSLTQQSLLIEDYTGQSSAIWHVSCSSHLSENLGSITTWHAKRLCISRRYTGNGKSKQGKSCVYLSRLETVGMRLKEQMHAFYC